MWFPDEDASTILDRAGPFSGARFRLAVVETLGWHDVTFGARLADGTQAAVPLLARRGYSESMPPSAYGEIAATRCLTPTEEGAFLDDARRLSRTTKLSLRGLGDSAGATHKRHLAHASVVTIDEVEPHERYSRLARRSLRRATEAGAIVELDGGAPAFLALYNEASQGWHTRYSSQLLTKLADSGAARLDIVTIDSKPVAGLFTVIGHSHWMCWLAAQSQIGRSVSASYLAYDAVFRAARAAGVPRVNLGASVGGGLEFKGHLGAKQLPMYEVVISTPVARARDAAYGLLDRVGGRVMRTRQGTK